MEIIFATNNKNKLREIRDILEPGFKILSLSDVNCSEELPESCNTIEGNASQKAWFVFNKLNQNCFADDTGLEIEALNGKPGVFSARFAGADCNSEKNIQKVLSEMKGIKNRGARFRCVLSLIINGKERQFEGEMNGEILHEKRGREGFGYDPIFAPFPLLNMGSGKSGGGKLKSFAEMTLDEKNNISHRAIAVLKMAEFLFSCKKILSLR